ncbi:MAG: TonB-dependent receptor [Prevotellaceae bacterium]|nr:TonB-dependent receptor [Prevotellaceae bacterium]
MNKKLLIAIMAVASASNAMAQSQDKKNEGGADNGEAAFTFTESQLGEDDDMNQNVTVINSNSNIYANEVGYLFSPVRFRYRAFNQKYNDVYINGALMNDVESGQFRYSMIGGLNNQTRSGEYALSFEPNNFAMPSMGGANNYNFRASAMPIGSKAAVSVANRNYTLRGMYSYSSGLNDKGWAVAGALTYRWADRGYVEGTFYNSLSYFLGIEKVTGNHSISFATWGNPTERASQGASTDEMYWIANDRYYNPYWGYQNGKKRNSRVVNDFAPTALLTWDWKINDDMKLTTSLTGKYSMYKSTKLNYNNSDNPHPDYWKVLPSSYFNVWDENDTSYRTEEAWNSWHTAYDYLTASKANRQIDFDRLYAANAGASQQGADAMYYIQAKHNNQLSINLSSTLDMNVTDRSKLVMGLNLGTTKGMHYQTMDDLLGASQFHNINFYALGTYDKNSEEIQYDLNNPNAVVKEGDKFGYDYNILVDKADYWLTYSGTFAGMHAFVSGRVGGTQMQRDGKMRNGLAKDNSYGKSGTARFLDGGGKAGITFNFGKGNILQLGAGYELRTPTASTAFASPEINNDFVDNLKNEKVFSADMSYQLNLSWLNASVNAYYSRIKDATEWQCFYFDDENSFSYVSLTGVEKEYYGVEYGLNFKINSELSVKAIGTVSEAKYASNPNVRYMLSTKGTYGDDVCLLEGCRESGTPLLAQSLTVSYNRSGWFIDLSGNYYDRIYLSPSVYYRYKEVCEKLGQADNEGNYKMLPQAEGNGGFMLDASIGKLIRLKKGQLSINLTLSNILNNRNICTGGYEQSRSDLTSSGNSRGYAFSQNPKKYYAYGTNGMLNFTYRF